MALSAPRTMHQQGYSLPVILTLKQKGSTTIYAGAFVELDGGYAAPAASASGKIAVGMAEETSVNGGSDGDVSVRVRTNGVFRWKVKSGDEPAQADVGSLVYMDTDEQVKKTGTSASVAGVLVAADGSTYADVMTIFGISSL